MRYASTTAFRAALETRLNAARTDEEQAIEILIDAARLDLDDGFEFAVERASSDADPGGSQRWSVTANVAGRLFERAAIDIDFATRPILDPQTIVSSELLTFADLEPVRIPALAIEQHVAEKLHAYTRTYASEQPTSRVKDLVDLVVIANTTELHAQRLDDAIDEIFNRRATHPRPTAVPAPPKDFAA